MLLTLLNSSHLVLKIYTGIVLEFLLFLQLFVACFLFFFSMFFLLKKENVACIFLEFS